MVYSNTAPFPRPVMAFDHIKPSPAPFGPRIVGTADVSDLVKLQITGEVSEEELINEAL